MRIAGIHLPFAVLCDGLPCNVAELGLFLTQADIFYDLYTWIFARHIKVCQSLRYLIPFRILFILGSRRGSRREGVLVSINTSFRRKVAKLRCDFLNGRTARNVSNLSFILSEDIGLLYIVIHEM